MNNIKESGDKLIMSRSIIQNKKQCYITKSTTNLHKHHIFEGTANRKFSEED